MIAPAPEDRSSSPQRSIPFTAQYCIARAIDRIGVTKDDATRPRICVLLTNDEAVSPGADRLLGIRKLVVTENQIPETLRSTVGRTSAIHNLEIHAEDLERGIGRTVSIQCMDETQMIQDLLVLEGDPPAAARCAQQHDDRGAKGNSESN